MADVRVPRDDRWRRLRRSAGCGGRPAAAVGRLRRSAGCGRGWWPRRWPRARFEVTSARFEVASANLVTTHSATTTWDAPSRSSGPSTIASSSATRASAMRSAAARSPRSPSNTRVKAWASRSAGSTSSSRIRRARRYVLSSTCARSTRGVARSPPAGGEASRSPSASASSARARAWRGSMASSPSVFGDVSRRRGVAARARGAPWPPAAGPRAWPPSPGRARARGGLAP